MKLTLIFPGAPGAHTNGSPAENGLPMTVFDIRAGDFGIGTGMLLGGVTFLLPVSGKIFEVQDVAACLLSSVEIATEENMKKRGGTPGWHIAGAAAPNPAEMLAGVRLDGRRKKIVFRVEFRFGEKMLVSGDISAFSAIQVAALGAPAAYAASLAPRE